MVAARLSYYVWDERPHRRFVAPGAEMNTGATEWRDVEIGDARTAGPFTLDRHGFQLFDCPSGIADFRDRAELDRRYNAEACGFVADLLGADLVLPLGYAIRYSKAVEGGDTQPPAADVHVDFTPDRGERFGPMLLERSGNAGFRAQRHVMTSFWRTFSPPPQDWPLALCEFSSLDPGEGFANVKIDVEKLPEAEEALGPWPGEETLPAATIFPWNPAHRWWHFPSMSKEEAVLLKFYDTDHSRAWRCAHTAFAHPAGGTPRESIEFRSVAYFA